MRSIPMLIAQKGDLSDSQSQGGKALGLRL